MTILYGLVTNIIMDEKKDRKGGKSEHTKSSTLLNAFLEEENWLDVWRHRNPNKFQFTWMRKDAKILSRLDYFLVPLDTYNSIIHCEIVPATLSDHCPVILNMEIDKEIRGPGYWKFNVKHLSDKEYVTEVNELIERAKNKYRFSKASNRIKHLKYDVKKFSISYSKTKATKDREEKDILEKKLKAAHKKLAMINVSAPTAIQNIQKVNERIDSLKLELQKKQIAQAQGAMLRSKVKWAEQAEHNTKYFYSLEKRNARSKIMKKAIDTQGNVMNEPQRILQEQARYFKTLYKADPNVKA